jgi:prevent-host-death family protein
MAERTVSATEARVHFGELLDSVTQKGDIVYVERAGVPQVVVVSVEAWKKRTSGNPLEGFMDELEEHWAFIEEERKAGRFKDFDAAELIRAGREERDEQLLGHLLGR